MEFTFSELTSESQENIRNGDIEGLILTYKKMAELFGEEQHFKDEIKVRIIVFHYEKYFHNSPSRINLALARNAVLESGLSLYDVSEMYLDIIKENMLPDRNVSIGEYCRSFIESIKDGSLETTRKNYVSAVTDICCNI